MKRNKAFTLAEVLITLTIIGVIAALTIPNLIQSYKKHQVEAGIKEAYSILNNALKMGIAENGSSGDILRDESAKNSKYAQTEWIDLYIIPYLKIVKEGGEIIGQPNLYNSYASKRKELACIRSEKSTEPINSGYWCTWGWRQLLLANGMLIGVANSGAGVQFWVDLNGPDKGPNRRGSDIFVFTLFKAMPIGNYYYNSQVTDRLFAGDCSLTAECRTSCSATSTGSGQNCEIVIQRNGWRIPDDYPIKKW